MTNPARASTQYDDLTGTIAIDGFHGLTVRDLFETAEIPSGYFPVGIRICGIAQSGIEGEGQPPELDGYVLCADTAQAGNGPDEIRHYYRENPELHTFRFPATINFGKLAKQLKLVDVMLISRIAEDTEVRIQPIDN